MDNEVVATLLVGQPHFFALWGKMSDIRVVWHIFPSAIWQTFWQSKERFGTLLRHKMSFLSVLPFGIAFVDY